MIRSLLLFIWLPLFALDLSIQSGREESSGYSILHLRESKPFKCTSVQNDFDEIVRIECQVSNNHPLPPIINPYFSLQHTPSSLIITPKKKIALFPIGFDLRHDAQVYSSDEKPIDHWMIIGYTKKLPMLQQTSANPNGINLPIKIAKESYPFVGGIDLKGNPIKMRGTQDVNEYMALKKAYNAKDYEKALFLAGDTLKKHPNTIFNNELILYQIRALHHLGEYEQILALSKQFIRQYSSDPAVAEVLAYTANAYSQSGQNSDSDYFYDRLFTEHAEDPFAAQGMFYKAQHLELVGSPKKAAQYYREALSRTKDVDLASACAFELARMEIGAGNLKKSKEYLEKIARVNPRYFGEVRDSSLELIEILKGQKDPLTAAKITKSLISSVPDKSQEHQVYLKKLGLLYAQGGEKQKALEAFNTYLKLFPYGESITEVRRAKDELFFEKEEPKGEKGVKKYDELIERYGNDSIAHKALYKKAQLLFKEKKYEAILKIENDLYQLDTTAYPEVNTIISQSAAEITTQKLKEQKCSEALSMQKMYKIKLMPQWDGLTFECALKMGNFPIAKMMTAKHLKAKNIAERQLWLSRVVKTHFALGEYKEATRGGKELMTLLEVQKNPLLNNMYRVMFDTAQRSSDAEGMIRAIKRCESAFGVDFKDIERYTQMVSLGLKRKDEVLIQSYAQKVITLQERTKTSTQSPFIEFTLAQSLMNRDKNKEALNILKSLDDNKLSSEKKSRQQYLIGSLAMKIGRNGEAKTAFNASIKADKNSAWGKLAKDALGLL
ncbi:MAG: tetratricopeptide repeat protein [Sulfuricurvum sp.]